MAAISAGYGANKGLAPCSGGIGRAPVPPEHGAWVILYAPLIVGFGAAPAFFCFPTILLTLTVTAAYLARHAAALLFRKRGKQGTGFWLGVYLAFFLIGGLPLGVVFGRWELGQIGGCIAALFAVHGIMTVWPSRKRLDRSVLGELLAVGALAMTGPAAYVVGDGRLDATALMIWTGNSLFYAGGVIHIKMYFRAATIKGEFHAAERLRAGRDNLLFHAALMLLVGWAAVKIGGPAGTPAWLAFVPAILRAFKGIATLTNRLPPLKRAGILETVYAVWFTGLLTAAIRAL